MQRIDVSCWYCNLQCFCTDPAASPSPCPCLLFAYFFAYFLPTCCLPEPQGSQHQPQSTCQISMVFTFCLVCFIMPNCMADKSCNKSCNRPCNKSCMILRLAMLQASMTSTEVKLCAAITTQSRQSLLAATPLTAISVWFTDNNTLMLKGVEQLVCRVRPCISDHALLCTTCYGVAAHSSNVSAFETH